MLKKKSVPVSGVGNKYTSGIDVIEKEICCDAVCVLVGLKRLKEEIEYLGISRMLREFQQSTSLDLMIMAWNSSRVS